MLTVEIENKGRCVKEWHNLYTEKDTERATLGILFIWDLEATGKTHTHTFTQAAHGLSCLHIQCDQIFGGFDRQNRNKKMKKRLRKNNAYYMDSWFLKKKNTTKPQVSTFAVVRCSLDSEACTVSLAGTEYPK